MLCGRPAGAPQPQSVALELSANASSIGGESSLGAEGRRAQRRQREAQWAAFRATKPAEGQDHPDDMAAISEAERTVGDYKLKTDPDYVLQEVSAWRRPGAPLGCVVAAGPGRQAKNCQ